MVVSTRGSLPNVDGDGIIYVSGISGGVGPYDVLVTGGGGPYTYSGIYGGVTIEDLQTGVYNVICTDNSGVSIPSGVTINEVSTLTISDVNSTRIGCAEAEDGTISFNINGGTYPYVIELTGPNGETYSNNPATGLKVGDYDLKVYDSYTQSATTSTITVGDAISLLISYTPTILTLSNTIDGINYDVIKGNVPIDTILATSSTIQYNVISGGTYSFISEYGCESDEIIITI